MAEGKYEKALEAYGKHFSKGKATIEQCYEAMRIENLRTYDDMRKAHRGKQNIYTYYNASARVKGHEQEAIYKQLAFLYEYLYQKNVRPNEAHQMMEMSLDYGIENFPDDIKLKKYEGIVEVLNYEIDTAMSEEKGKVGYDVLTAYLASDTDSVEGRSISWVGGMCVRENACGI